MKTTQQVRAAPRFSRRDITHAVINIAVMRSKGFNLDQMTDTEIINKGRGLGRKSFPLIRYILSAEKQAAKWLHRLNEIEQAWAKKKVTA